MHLLQNVKIKHFSILAFFLELVNIFVLSYLGTLKCRIEEKQEESNTTYSNTEYNSLGGRRPHITASIPFWSFVYALSLQVHTLKPNHGIPQHTTSNYNTPSDANETNTKFGG